jgi:hypothetical protein
MYKNIAQTEKMAAIENVADPKIIGDGKIIVDVKIMADPKKSLRMMKCPRLEKNRRMVKSLRALKSPRLVKYRQPWKSGKASGLLTGLPGLADEHVLFIVDVMNLACSLHVRNGLLVSSFYGRTLSRTVPAVCTGPPCQGWPKSFRQPKVWLLPEIPLISVKSQNF